MQTGPAGHYSASVEMVSTEKTAIILVTGGSGHAADGGEGVWHWAPRQNLSSRPVASSTIREPQPSCPFITPPLLLRQHEVQDQPKPAPPPASRLPPATPPPPPEPLRS